MGKVPGNGFANWADLKFVLQNFVADVKPGKLTDETTPGLNRFCRSSRSRVPRSGTWRYMTNMAAGIEGHQKMTRPMREFDSCVKQFIWSVETSTVSKCSTSLALLSDLSNTFHNKVGSIENQIKVISTINAPKGPSPPPGQ